MTTPEDRIVWEADEEALYRSAHEAARGATEGDETGSRVVGEGSDAQEAREASGARLARYAEALVQVDDEALVATNFGQLGASYDEQARAVMAVADAELEQARAENATLRAQLAEARRG